MRQWTLISIMWCDAGQKGALLLSCGSGCIGRLHGGVAGWRRRERYPDCSFDPWNFDGE